MEAFRDSNVRGCQPRRHVDGAAKRGVFLPAPPGANLAGRASLVARAGARGGAFRSELACRLRRAASVDSSASRGGGHSCGWSRDAGCQANGHCGARVGASQRRPRHGVGARSGSGFRRRSRGVASPSRLRLPVHGTSGRSERPLHPARHGARLGARPVRLRARNVTGDRSLRHRWHSVRPRHLDRAVDATVARDPFYGRVSRLALGQLSESAGRPTGHAGRALSRCGLRDRGLYRQSPLHGVGLRAVAGFPALGRLHTEYDTNVAKRMDGAIGLRVAAHARTGQVASRRGTTPSEVQSGAKAGWRRADSRGAGR